MPILILPIEKIMLCGLPPAYYMAECLKAKGAPVEIHGNKVTRSEKIKQQEDKNKKNIIFTWEDK